MNLEAITPPLRRMDKDGMIMKGKAEWE